MAERSVKHDKEGGLRIPKGYYIKARVIDDSEIAHAPPHVREIWDYLLRIANHTAKQCRGTTIRRGQVLTSYKVIQEALHWMVGWRKESYSKSQCETAVNWLKKRVMIRTQKTTRGLIITINNYEFYQNPANYEAYTETGRNHTRNLQTADTINKNGNKDKKTKEYSPTSDEFRLSTLLFEQIRERKSDFKEPNLQKWSIHIDRMIRLDKRAPANIEVVIRWCQQDDFWQNNIISTEKLRRQFDRLELKMDRTEKKNKKESTAERAARMKQKGEWME
ncbi:hypothetical protein ACFL1G_08865 [Planctomycetota bacterium]